MSMAWQQPSPRGRRRPYRQRPRHESSSRLILGTFAVLALGCASLSWRLGHHTEIQAEVGDSWLAQSLVGGDGDGPAAAAAADDDVPTEERVIIHFSTDCTTFQHWQALTLLDSAVRVGQRGAIVRVVSGCEKASSLTGEEQLTEERVRADHERFLGGDDSTPFRFHLLFIGDMTAIGSAGARYKFATKCKALHHWIDELGGGTLRDVVGDGVPGAEEDHDVAVVSIGTACWLACLAARPATCPASFLPTAHFVPQTHISNIYRP